MAGAPGLATTSSVVRGLDDGPMRTLQIRTIILCAMVTMLDGIDNQSIGVVAPLLSRDLGLDKAAMGTIFSVTQFGATLGALLFGPIGDRFGRKPALVIAMTIIAVFTWLTAIVPSFGLMLLTRFLAGIGLAGIFSSALALTSEYSPLRLRGTLVAVVYAGYPTGAAIGGLAAAWIMTHYDWRLVLYLGAAIGAATMIAVTLWMPESIRFLLARGEERGRQLDRTLARLGLDRTAVAGDAPEHGEKPPAVSLWTVFRGGLAPLTVLLCLINFFVSATTKIMVVWFPSILADNGYTVAHAALAQAMFNIGCLIAMLFAGYLVDRFGTARALVPALVLDAVCVASLGLAGGSFAATMTLAALVGAFIGVGAAGVQAMAAALFPVEMRSTGIGWGTASSRFGQILSPMLVALMLSQGVGMAVVYGGLAAAPLLAALAAMGFAIVGRRKAARTAEDAEQVPPARLSAVPATE